MDKVDSFLCGWLCGTILSLCVLHFFVSLDTDCHHDWKMGVDQVDYQTLPEEDKFDMMYRVLYQCRKCNEIVIEPRKDS